MRITLSRYALAISLALASASASVLFAQQDPNSEGSPDDQGFQQTVARVSSVMGDATFQRGDDPDHWQALAANIPLTIGDRLYSSEAGRVELEAPGLHAFVAPGTELSVLNLTEDVQQYSIAEGTATFRVSHMDDEDVFEIDTPNAAVTLEATGLYRVYVDADGNTRVWVRRGEARVSAGGGEVALRTGEAMHIDGIDSPEYDVFALPLADSWDRWVDSRERRRHTVVSYDYASEDIVGVSDLDSYGRWEETPGYGNVWFPANVASDWAPYRAGRWIWQDPWGWTWVSSEPWGWAPYHYGRWVVFSSRWCWVPVAPRVRHVAYAPALVAFVGGGPGWSASVSVGGGGFVGWFPLGPRDPVNPWWGARARTQVSVTNVTYVNRSYVTVVSRDAFVNARPANAALVRDSSVIRQAAQQPVLRGPMPVLPTAQSIRGPSTERVGAKPSQRILERPVAARLAPPPAPPAFSEKIGAIRENRGAPMTPSAAAKIVTQSPQGARAAVPIRPVARESGHVDLAPRREAVGAPPPDPIRTGSRAIASPQAPFISHPSGSRENAQAMRIAPGAVTTPLAKPTPFAQPVIPAQPPSPARRLENQPGRPVVISPPARPTPVTQPAPRSIEQNRPPQVEQVHPVPQIERGRAPQVEQPRPAPQVERAPQPERREFSRAPRRVAPAGPDPLAAHGRAADKKATDEKGQKGDKNEKK